ncbi:MAG TPA: chitinase [Acidimicrobiales bacterium]|nr:chitinase [Acidimicrobiales bacterium]
MPEIPPEDAGGAPAPGAPAGEGAGGEGAGGEGRGAAGGGKGAAGGGEGAAGDGEAATAAPGLPDGRPAGWLTATARPGRAPLPAPRAVLPAPEQSEPRQRLSATRLLLAAIIVAAILLGGGYGVRSAIETQSASDLGATWFAPYVDVTASPTYQFQVPADEPARQVVLGFVTAAGRTSCTPSWGGDTLAQAAQSLSLDTRLAELRQEGVGAVVSFGGQAGTDLAVACDDQARLVTAYQSVIARYQANTIDLDIEGGAETDFAAVKRRAEAIRALQLAAEQAHSQLSIWLTLPVERSGLDGAGISVVTQMLRDKVRIAGIDVMAMDYGPAVSDMGAAAEQALWATHAQLASLYPRYGVRLSAAQLFHTMGVTVMIGQNGDPGERFSLADASTLEGFARSEHLGRVSIWSLNRDSECGSDFGEVGVLSNSCSGVSEASLAFDATFTRLTGSASALAGQVTPAGATGAQLSQADSPYPIWQAADPYVTGYKVVWQGNVYQAKWFNQGDDPAADVQYAWQTPWLLIGPVLPGEHSPTTTTLPVGTYPAWSPSVSYRAGADVLFAGLPYQARWYNQGQSPAAEASDPSGSPWQPLYRIPGEPTGSEGG